MTATRPPDEPLRGRTDETLREVADDADAVAELVARLAGADDMASLTARADGLRLLGRLPEAEDTARRAVGAAGLGSEPDQAAMAHLALARVLHRQERHDDAEQEFAVALADADQARDQRLRAEVLHHRGVNRYDAGRAREAERDFTAALQIRRRGGAPDDELLASEQAVAAAVRRILAGSSRREAG